MSATDTAPKPSRGRSIALVVSLALNVLLAALIVVGVMRAMDRAFLARPGGVLAPAAVMRELPEDRRDAIRAVQMKHRQAMQADRSEARRARLAVFRIFAAPQFDMDAFDKASAQVRDADHALEDESIAMVHDVAAALTPEERREVAAKARRRLRWLRPWVPN